METTASWAEAVNDTSKHFEMPNTHIENDDDDDTVCNGRLLLVANELPLRGENESSLISLSWILSAPEPVRIFKWSNNELQDISEEEEEKCTHKEKEREATSLSKFSTPSFRGKLRFTPTDKQQTMKAEAGGRKISLLTVLLLLLLLWNCSVLAPAAALTTSSSSSRPRSPRCSRGARPSDGGTPAAVIIAVDGDRPRQGLAVLMMDVELFYVLLVKLRLRWRRWRWRVEPSAHGRPPHVRLSPWKRWRWLLLILSVLDGGKVAVARHLVGGGHQGLCWRLVGFVVYVSRGSARLLRGHEHGSVVRARYGRGRGEVEPGRFGLGALRLGPGFPPLGQPHVVFRRDIGNVAIGPEVSVFLTHISARAQAVHALNPYQLVVRNPSP